MNKNIWQVYLLKCYKDGTYYCGITNEIVSRLLRHHNGTASKYTRGRGPFKLLAITGLITRSRALKIEHLIKKTKKKNKIMKMILISKKIERERMEDEK